VRVLADVAYAPIALQPRLSPVTGQDLDMSMCFLRSMSPIHIQYLQNMGVGATLVASLMVGGKLWGLIACHHYVPRFAHFEVRAVCELLAEVVGTRIAALESFVQAQAELSVRRLEQRMAEAIARHGDWKVALFDGSTALLQHVGATGAALLFEGQVYTVGDVPGTQELREIGAWLDRKSRGNSTVVATASLSIDEPAFASIKSSASGVLSTRVSRSPEEHLVWFRPERIRTVTWGGDPNKSVVVGTNPADLSPRRSFAQWHQLVENTSEAWTQADLVAARLIGESVADVVLQFRSVRMLIAQNQLEQVKRQVTESDIAVVICDPKGQILQSNETFERLLPARAKPRSINDFPAMFVERKDAEQRFAELLNRREPCRLEVRLEFPTGEMRPLRLRADPVFSTPDLLLGFVFLFTDLTERKAAEEARSRFQQDMISRHKVTNIGLDSTADLVFQNMLSSIIGNAQLAALEITDGVDMARMPEMLDSVYASVTRTAEVLEQLVWHSTGASQDDG
jgi:PAS domain S-box-containing protein